MTVHQLDWIDAVAEAFAALRRVMADDRAEPKTQFAAAETILRLEMTRIRTGRPVTGTEDDATDDPGRVSVWGGVRSPQPESGGVGGLGDLTPPQTESRPRTAVS